MFKSSHENATILTITPQEAERLLSTSIGNRKMRDYYIHSLSDAIKRGEWLVTSQGIGIDENGCLRDGHHRLSACVKSGMPIRIAVITGLKAGAYEVTDTGVIRNIADRLSLNKSVAEILSLAARLYDSSTRPSSAQIRKIGESGLLDIAENLIEYCPNNRRYFSSAPIKLAACIKIMDGENSMFVKSQYKALCEADYDHMCISAKSLSRQADMNGAHKKTESRAMLAKALKVFTQGKDMEKMRMTDASISLAIDYVRSVIETRMHNTLNK